MYKISIIADDNEQFLCGDMVRVTTTDNVREGQIVSIYTPTMDMCHYITLSDKPYPSISIESILNIERV